MKQITDFKVISNTGVKSRMYCLELTPADGQPMGECRPGQFVEMRVDGTPEVFLRRPISIHKVNKETNTLSLLIQCAGRATNHAASLKPGDIVNIVYPLGNGFTIDSADAQRYLLIGGGVGIAPLLELGDTLKAQGKDVTYLLGVRSLDDDMMTWIEPYAQSARLLLTTEDGSARDIIDATGAKADIQKGFVTMHSAFTAADYDAIRVCGPGPMMNAVMNKVREEMPAGVPAHFCEVSLENRMACGIGVCLCCVQQTKDGHKCVCSDGPVFDINDL